MATNLGISGRPLLGFSGQHRAMTGVAISAGVNQSGGNVCTVDLIFTLYKAMFHVNYYKRCMYGLASQ